MFGKMQEARVPSGSGSQILKFVDWSAPEDMFTTYGSADLLGRGSSRIVFDIGGNNYRMICKYLFSEPKVHLYIKWIGSHAEYDKLCGKREQYTIDIY
jgi:mRNA interferase HigB